MNVTDDKLCGNLIDVLTQALPNVTLQGGAEEPFYAAPTPDTKAVLYFRNNYPRSLLHELSHYCLAGARRRQIDDFGFWYTPCGRSRDEQRAFECVEARPQGLEKALCEAIGIDFSPSLDDFSGEPPSSIFLDKLEQAYQEMLTTPPPTAKIVLEALATFETHNKSL